MNEIQVIATLMSSNPEVDGDIPALIGTSAALALSGIPFNGPIGAARVGYSDGQYLLNPSKEELETSKLDLVVAGTEHAMLMVESEAEMLSEEVMLGAVMFGHEQMQTVINAINEFKTEVGVSNWDWTAPEADQALADKLAEGYSRALTEAYQIADKLQRQDKVSELRADAVEKLWSKPSSDRPPPQPPE